MSLAKPLPAVLPCFPCPHASICCSWGTGLFEDEAAAIRQRYGDQAVSWSEDEMRWRTSIVNGRCFFWGNGCSIHDQAFYPRICRGFPWTYADTDDAYPFDLTICPELADH
jgi:hypothetical protein